jgi:hypothetical protein
MLVSGKFDASLLVLWMRFPLQSDVGSHLSRVRLCDPSENREVLELFSVQQIKMAFLKANPPLH